jgi:hypothetical protein
MDRFSILAVAVAGHVAAFSTLGVLAGGADNNVLGGSDGYNGNCGARATVSRLCTDKLSDGVTDKLV